MSVQLLPVKNHPATEHLVRGRLLASLMTVNGDFTTVELKCRNAMAGFSECSLPEATHIYGYSSDGAQVFVYPLGGQPTIKGHDRKPGLACHALLMFLADVRPLRVGTKVVVHKDSERQEQLPTPDTSHWDDLFERPARVTQEALDRRVMLLDRAHDLRAKAWEVLEEHVSEQEDFSNEFDEYLNHFDGEVTQAINDLIERDMPQEARAALIAAIRYRGLVRSIERLQEGEASSSEALALLG